MTDVRRFRADTAEAAAHALLTHLRALPGVERAEAAGSLRRRRDAVGDLDLLAVSDRGRAVIEAFTAHDDVREVHGAGTTRASVVLRGGLRVDLRVVPARSFGAAWACFTGSKAHNIALRRMAQARGLKINEYGVFRGTRQVAGADEASVYAAVGLPWIPPELREDRGEFDAARTGRLPVLVERADLRGDLHVHTTDSDGRHDLEALAAAARDRGLQYLAITDHSARVAVTHGLDATRLERQIERIDRLNERLRRERAGLTLLKGIEVDILRDGRLDLPDALLGRLDLVVGSVHEGFDLPAERQTARVLRALDHPHFSILAHPTARLIEERAPIALDLARVLRHARERGCFVEHDSQPARLDLDDAGCRLAKAEGVRVSIASDAHSTFDLEDVHFGVGQARRGGLEKGDVLNSLPLRALRALLARTM
jgi:DNA polymerase (family 10)